MTEIVVGARLDLKTNTLLPAVEATQAQFAKLEEAAKKADAAVDRVVGQSGGKKPTLDLFGPGKSGDDLANEIAKVETALGRYLGRLDPAARAIKTQVEGHTLLSRALELGIISQAQYEQGLARVTKAAEQQLLTKQNLLKGHLDLHQSLRVGASLLAGFAGGLAASVASMVLSEGATLALKAAQELLLTRTDEVTRAHERLGQILASGQIKGEAAQLSSRERARLYRIETENLRSLAQSQIDNARAALAAKRIEVTISRSFASPDQAEFDPEVKAQIERIRKMEEELALWEFKRGYGQPSETGPAKTDRPPRTGTRRRTASMPDFTMGERDLLRQAEAAIKAKRALDEYAEASQDIIEKASAELSGRRELIAQIEIEAQLRKRYGVEFVEQNRERIAALAKERAEAERVAGEYKKAADAVQFAGEQLGSALQATIIAPLDETGRSMQELPKVWQRAVTAIIAETTRLYVVKPLIDSVFRLTGSALGSLFGGATGNTALETAKLRHGGGYVDGAGPARAVPAAVFAVAPRAHSGLYLAPNERPVIAQEGEAIFTPRQLENGERILRRMAAQSSQPAPQINVTVIDQRNNGGAPVEVRRRVGAGGRVDIDVIVKDAVKRAFNEGALDQTVLNNFGLPRRGQGGR